jgi:hypothetical protein
VRPKSGSPKPEAKSLAKKKPSGKDVVLVHGVSEDGESLAVLRARENRVEAGVVRAVKEGEPPQGEVIKLTPRPEMPLVCDVETLVPEGLVNAAGGSDGKTSHNGPAQVATQSYRANWDRIWSRPKASKPN